MIKTLLSTITVAVLAGVYTAPSHAASTLFESRDILNPTQALGRFQWLEKCYQELVLGVADEILDVTTPRTNGQKIESLKNTLLYKDGVLRSDAKYLTFGDVEHQNPKSWFAGASATDGCVQIPSDYGISGLLITPTTPQYCTAKSRDKEYEYIKEVSFSDLTNTSDGTVYSNFVGQAAKIYHDTDYLLTLTPGFASEETFPESWHVFIDWNQDGDFSDLSESHFVGASETSISKTLTPPAGTVKGLTKMRVTMDYFGGNADACAEINSGEIEDYLIYIK